MYHDASPEAVQEEMTDAMVEVIEQGPEGVRRQDGGQVTETANKAPRGRGGAVAGPAALKFAEIMPPEIYL